MAGPHSRRSDGRGRLSVPSARRTYGLIAAVVVVLLLGGLLVPLVYGDPETELQSGGSATAMTLAPLTDQASDESAPDAIGGSSSAAGATVTTAPRLSAVERAGLTASDVGVTSTAVKIGVVLLDLRAVEPLGLGIENFEPETQQRMFQAYFDDVNRRGGINGRALDAAYVVNDPLATSNAGNARAQCLHLTNDLKVFAVIGYITDATACVAREQRTPTVKYTADLAEVYAQSRNYLSDPVPSFERIAAGWAGAMEDLGNLKGKTIGVVAGEAPAEDKPASTLQATIEQLGYKVAHRTRLSSDAGTAQSQVPLEVQRMRSKGIDLVFFPTNFATAIAWVQAAEGQGWTPRYTTSDIGALAAGPLVRNMPGSFEGAIGITSSYGGTDAAGKRAPERPHDAACRELHNGTTDGKDYAWGEVSPMLQICGMVQILERAAVAAGTKLTREGFVAATQAFGEFLLPTYIGGSFRKGKTDYSDFVKPLRWVTACKCYVNTGDAMRARY